MISDRLRQLNLNLLFTLDAVLRHRNLTQAAADLNVTQGAVSQSLARLRLFFDDPLLVKIGNDMQPTAFGEELQSRVTDVLNLINDTVLSREAFDPATATGTLRLCLTDIGEFALLPALVDRLGRDAPKLDLRMLNLPDEHLLEAMRSGRVDLAVAGPLDVGVELKQEMIFENELVVLVHRDCPLPDVITVEDYVSLPHIALEAPMVKRFYLDRMLSNMGLRRHVRVRTANGLVQPFLLSSQPHLIATVTRLFGQRMASSSDLRVVQFGFDVPKIPVYQYWHRRFERHAMSLWLRDLVRQITANLGSDLEGN